MTDYQLSKLIFDMQNPELRAQYRADRAAIIARYGIAPAVAEALMTDDAAALAPLVNAYLLRYYFSYIGMPDEQFIARLRGEGAKELRS